MQEELNYVIATDAMTVNFPNIMEQVKCTFIGTKKYLFVVPFNKVDFQINYSNTTTETTDFFYEGMPLQDFLIEKLKEPGLKSDDFEKFMIDTDFSEMKAINIEDDIEQFKVNANFWGSSIATNTQSGRTGWKPFALKFKKKKKSIRAFYEGHHKLVN